MSNLTRKEKIVLISVAAFVVAISIYLCFFFNSGPKRPVTLSTLDIEKYRDNPKLYDFAKELKKTFRENQYLSLNNDLSNKMKDIYKTDKRLSEVISAALRERENSLRKNIRHIKMASQIFIDKFYILFDSTTSAKSFWGDIRYNLFPYNEQELYSRNIFTLSSLARDAGVKDISEALREVANDNTLSVQARGDAILSLALQERKSTLPLIRRFMKDKDPEIKDFADIAFCIASSIDEIKKAISKDRSMSFQFLRAMLLVRKDEWKTEECDRMVCSFLTDSDPSVKMSALQFLQRMNYEGYPTHADTNVLLDIMGQKDETDERSRMSRSLASFIVASRLYANKGIQSRLEEIRRDSDKYENDFVAHPTPEIIPLDDNDAEKAIKILLDMLDEKSVELSNSALRILMDLTFRDDVFTKYMEEYSAEIYFNDKATLLDALVRSRRPGVTPLLNSFLSQSGTDGIVNACFENPNLRVPFFNIISAEEELRGKHSIGKLLPIVLDIIDCKDKDTCLASLKLLESYGNIPGAENNKKLLELLGKCIKDQDSQISDTAKKIIKQNGLKLSD